MTDKKKIKNNISISLEEILNLIPGHIYWKDLEGRYLGCNLQQAKTLGLASQDDLIGKTDFDLSTKKCATEFSSNDKKVIKTKKPITVMEPIPNEKGEIIYYFSKKAPVFDKNGNVIGVVGSTFDLTNEQKEKLFLLQKKEQTELTLEKVISLMPGNVYWKDSSGKFLGCNLSQAKSLGFNSPKNLIGKTAYDTLPKNQADEIFKADQNILKTGKQYFAEEISNSSENKPRSYLSKKVPLKNKNGEVIGLLGVSLDITERKKLEKALANANNEKTEFIAALNNTLRSQINTIALMAEMLRNSGGLSAKQEEYLHLLEEANNSMPADLMYAADYAKLDSGDLTLYNDFCCPLYHVEQIFDLYYRRAIKKGIDFFVDYGELPQSLLYTSATQLREILSILLEQAINYTEKGEIYLSFSREQTQDQKTLVITLHDTGPGFEPDYVPHLFSLSGAKKNSESDYPMMSMKFAFCKKLVEALNGEISVNSKLGHGTSFSIRFAEKTLPSGEKSRLPKQNWTFDYAQKQNYILIDDNPTRAKATLSLFQKSHIKHTTTENAVETIKQDANESNSANLILIDESVLLETPQLLNQIRENINNENCLILIFSYSPTRQLKEWAEYHRNVALFKKPILWTTFYNHLIRLWNAFNERPLEILSIEDDPVCQRGLELVLQNFDCNLTSVSYGEQAMALLETNDYHAIFLDIGLPGKSGLVVAQEIKEQLGENCPLLIALTGMTRKIDVDKLYFSNLFMAVLEKPATLEQLKNVVEDIRNPPDDEEFEN